MWVRRRDWHVLSHGLQKFTTDERFVLAPDPPLAARGSGSGYSDYGDQPENFGRQDWVLMIKHVVARDSGVYECQVSYHHLYIVSSSAHSAAGGEHEQLHVATRLFA